MLIPIMYNLLKDKKLAYIINIEKWFICILLGLLRTRNVKITQTVAVNAIVITLQIHREGTFRLCRSVHPIFLYSAEYYIFLDS